MLWLTSPYVPVTVSVPLPSEALEGSETVRLIALPGGLTWKEPPVQLPVLTEQTTLIIELKELMDCAVRFSVIALPGRTQALSVIGGFRLKSTRERVNGTEAELGPLATSTMKG